jgi:FkbM family methyltransferase
VTLSYQTLLRRLCEGRLLRGRGHALLHRRTWTVERGPGAGLKLAFPQNPDFVSGTSEPPVQREIARLLRSGSVFYDIGANIGFFSLIAARLVGPQGHVCAFEPHPGNAATVATNARLNALSHIRVIEAAIGSSSRVDQLLMTDWDGGAALSGYPVGRSAEVRRTAVQVVRLDDYIAARQLPLPTLVKIDVEGAEMEVIGSMTQTIERCAPTLLYEIDDGDMQRFQRRWDELDARVRALGYAIVRLDPSYPNLNWQVGHSLAVPAATHT